MDRKDLFCAIDECRDSFVQDTAEDIEKKKIKKSGVRWFCGRNFGFLTGVRVVAAVFIMAVILSIGVKTAAKVSTVFCDWIKQTFGIDIGDNSESERIIFRDNMQVTGVNESFIYESRWDKKDNEIVEKVYSIGKRGKLKKLSVKSFTGTCNGKTISFDYSVIGQEIFGYNCKGDTAGVFHKINKNNEVYVDVMRGIHRDSETAGSEGIICVNLKTGECRQVLKDGNGRNMSMSSQGKYILINYNKEYWTAFDTEKETEKKVEGLSGVALSDEYDFVDANHITTAGDAFVKEDTEYYRLNYVDLRTGKTKIYSDYGDMKGRWSYQYKKGKITVHDIVSGNDETITTKGEKAIHMMNVTGNYVLFAEDNYETYYLYNLENGKSRELTVPKEIRGTLDLHIVQKEEKLLLTNEKEGYLVDMDL